MLCRACTRFNVFAIFCSGGLELLFDKKHNHDVEVDAKEGYTLSELLVHIRDNMLKERPELFMQENTV